jgi:hypothetical protein
VLLLHRHMRHADVVAGLTAAVGIGASSADVVAVEARNPNTPNHSAGGLQHLVAVVDEPEQRVVSLTARRLADPAAAIAGLPPDTRPVPSLAGYDELLARRGGARSKP